MTVSLKVVLSRSCFTDSIVVQLASGNVPLSTAVTTGGVPALVRTSTPSIVMSNESTGPGSQAGPGVQSVGAGVSIGLVAVGAGVGDAGVSA